MEQEVNRAREVLREQVASLAVKGAESILRKEVDASKHADLLSALKTRSCNLMAEFATIARPYAKALFSLAQEKTKSSLGWAN